MGVEFILKKQEAYLSSLISFNNYR